MFARLVATIHTETLENTMTINPRTRFLLVFGCFVLSSIERKEMVALKWDGSEKLDKTDRNINIGNWKKWWIYFWTKNGCLAGRFFYEKNCWPGCWYYCFWLRILVLKRVLARYSLCPSAYANLIISCSLKTADVYPHGDKNKALRPLDSLCFVFRRNVDAKSAIAGWVLCVRKHSSKWKLKQFYLSIFQSVF